MSRFRDPWDFDTDPNPERLHNPVRVDFDSIKASSELAVLIIVGEDKYWIPKSQIGELEKKTGRFATGGHLTIPEWLAIEKELV